MAGDHFYICKFSNELYTVPCLSAEPFSIAGKVQSLFFIFCEESHSIPKIIKDNYYVYDYNTYGMHIARWIAALIFKYYASSANIHRISRRTPVCKNLRS